MSLRAFSPTADAPALRSQRSGPVDWVLSIALVVVLAGIAGGLTSLGQLVLPGLLAPLANSSSGWTLLAVGVVAATRAPAPRAAVLGLLAFSALTLGYTVVSELRGIAFDPTFWLTVGVVAGPVVGAATALLRSADQCAAACAVGVLSGILVGEGIYGLVVIAATTGVAYWIAVLVLGIAAIPAVASRRRWRMPAIAVAAAGTLGIACALFVGYTVVLPALLL